MPVMPPAATRPFDLKRVGISLGRSFTSSCQCDNVAHNGLADSGECFLHELQGVFRDYVTSLGIIVVFIVVDCLDLVGQ